jgi:hypothetical protein
MSTLTSLLPKVLVFGVSVVVGAVIASVAVGAMQNEGPVSTVGVAPQYLLQGPDTPAGPGVPVAFDEEETGVETALASLPPEDLSAAAEALLGGETVSFTNPAGFPRIPPVTQFDGGPFQGSNCTLASGAMLARLGFGIVTSGSTLRTLQDDQSGGTGIGDLATALWRGYGVSLPSGLLRPASLKDLLASGYGAVVQGDYSKIPRALRLQKDFTGGHAIYLDGYYPGDDKRGIPEAYYVIDPIGRPKYGYQGEWWPASVVDDFATAFGGGRIAAMWAFPPGGVPPEVVGPDVVPIPPDNGGDGTGEPAEPGSSEVPSGAPGGPIIVAPGDVGDLIVELSPGHPPVGDPGFGRVALKPVFDICLLTPKPPGCPSGIRAVFATGSPPLLQLPPGPTVEIAFVDSDRPNVAIVGYTVDPPGPSDVRFWEADGSPATVRTSSAMSTVSVLGKTVIVARLDVAAGTTYKFQAVAGDGLFAGSSPVGTFTSGDGVTEFSIELSQAASPVFKLEPGLSPYLHQAAGAYARPMVPLVSLGGASCLESADYGGTAYCLDVGSGAPAPTCTRAAVTYALTGIDADEVLVRAYPTVAGVRAGGGLTLDGVIEASGPAPSGIASVGCLASGLSYTIVLDAVGDDRGTLAKGSVTVP